MLHAILLVLTLWQPIWHFRLLSKKCQRTKANLWIHPVLSGVDNTFGTGCGSIFIAQLELLTCCSVSQQTSRGCAELCYFFLHFQQYGRKTMQVSALSILIGVTWHAYKWKQRWFSILRIYTVYDIHNTVLRFVTGNSGWNILYF